MALRISWAAVCFGKPFLGGKHTHTHTLSGIRSMWINKQSWIYLPLPIEGKATDLSFFSSARARQFFTVLSSISSHLSEPQLGLLQWITYFAGSPKPAVKTAGEERWWGAARTEDEEQKSSNKEPPKSHDCFLREPTGPAVADATPNTAEIQTLYWNYD